MAMRGASVGEAALIRIRPYEFVHVLDTNTSISRVEIGPKLFVKQDHEKIILGPDPMISIPPRHYCIIANPVVRSDDKQEVVDKEGRVIGWGIALDSHGQVKVHHGDLEIRFEQDPFPLYPGENLKQKPTPLTVVRQDTALRLRALQDFDDEVEGKSVKRIAGDEWLFEGPATYKPRIEVQAVEVIKSLVVKPNQGLKLRARQACIDRTGKSRDASEEWIVRKVGAYLPSVDEELVEILSAHVLTERKAIHLRALRTFTDVYGIVRKAGAEWLVTHEMSETHIIDVFEQYVCDVPITSVSSRQYCVIVDPVVDGTPRFGQRKLIRGETSFFLQPGERLEQGIQNVHVLAEEEALLLRAREAFSEEIDENNQKVSVKRVPGDRWMIYGPCEYVPPAEVEIAELRVKIPLSENEGLYVRDMRKGKVRIVTGESYMLQPHEELWQKKLPKVVEDLLALERDPYADRNARDLDGQKVLKRDATRVVTLKVPHNSAVQIYDFRLKQARVVFGPELIMLGPDEEFTVLSLSGGKPKSPGKIKALCLLLGPDFMTDIIVVETSDHARLQLQLSYNWHFDVDIENAENAARIFQVPDFVGDACKAIASRVRGAVASTPFDTFHQSSAKIIRQAVFGRDDEGHVKDKFSFDNNLLVVTNIDIQNVEPVDQKTRDSLQKSVQLAIEITTNSQEARARQDAERLEQMARGQLEEQKIIQSSSVAEKRRGLMEIEAKSAEIEATGKAVGKARAEAESRLIQAKAAVEQAELTAQAENVAAQNALTRLKATQSAEIEHKAAITNLEITRAKELAAIEAEKFGSLVKAIGADTIKSIANAGPELQAKLLGGLGLSGYLITDGRTPINLFNTAKSMIGGGGVPVGGLPKGNEEEVSDEEY